MIRFSARRATLNWLLLQEFIQRPLEKSHSDVTRTYLNKHKFTEREKQFRKSVCSVGLKIIQFYQKKGLPDNAERAVAWYLEDSKEIYIFHPSRWIKKEGYIATLAHELGHHYHKISNARNYNHSDKQEIIAEIFALELLTILNITVNSHRSLDYLASYVLNLKLREKEFIRLYKQTVKLVREFLNDIL